MQTCYIGPIPICFHSLSIWLAIAFGALTLWLSARQYGADFSTALDAALLGLLLGIIAGRVELVLTNLDYFRERPTFIIDPRQGGFSYRSLLVIGIITYLLAAQKMTTRWRLYADVLTPAVAIAATIAWVGAALTGQSAGAVNGGVLSLPLPDAYGIVAPRFPVQPLLAAINFLIFLLALSPLPSYLPPGLSLFTWGATVAAAGAVTDNFLAETATLNGGLPTVLVVDLAFAALWLLLAVLILRNTWAEGMGRTL